MALPVHETKGTGHKTKTIIAQRLPEEFEQKITKFQRMIIRMRQHYDYDFQQIVIMDETPMNFDMPPTRRVSPSGERTIHIKTTGNEKNHFTVVFSCLADGTKLMPVIIFKRKAMPKEYISHHKCSRMYTKKDGWMRKA